MNVEVVESISLVIIVKIVVNVIVEMNVKRKFLLRIWVSRGVVIFFVVFVLIILLYFIKVVVLNFKKIVIM